MTVVSIFRKDICEQYTSSMVLHTYDHSQKKDDLNMIINTHYNTKIDSNFLHALFCVIHDNAFNFERNMWFGLKVIKEVDYWVGSLGYKTFDEWIEHTYMLNHAFTSKSQALKTLEACKQTEVQSMILSRALTIHPLLYKIMKKNISNIIPDNVFSRISFDKIESVKPMVERVVDAQSVALLNHLGYENWNDFLSLRTNS